jgi:DNA-binding MarR family transcriptional regulator
MPTWILTQASIRAHRLLTDALGTAGSRGYEYRVLSALDEFGPASQASLGRRTQMDRSDVVPTVNALVTQGYATRRRDPSDSRRNIITITSSGLKRYRRLDRIILTVQDRLLSPLDSSEREIFVGLLKRIVGS